MKRMGTFRFVVICRWIAAIFVFWLFGALLVAQLHGDELADDDIADGALSDSALPDNVKNGRELFERV